MFRNSSLLCDSRLNFQIGTTTRALKIPASEAPLVPSLAEASPPPNPHSHGPRPLGSFPYHPQNSPGECAGDFFLSLHSLASLMLCVVEGGLDSPPAQGRAVSRRVGSASRGVNASNQFQRKGTGLGGGVIGKGAS